MDKFSNRLVEAMERINITQAELVKRTGINKGAISSYISGRYEPKQKAIYELAKALNVNEAWLLGYDVSMLRENDQAMYLSAGLDYIKIPLYDNLCCGNGGFVDDNIIDYIPVPSAGLNLSKEYFCQYAQGDSMKDAGIIDHDLLVFEKTPVVSNNDIGCFCIDENVATCKKYRETGGIIALVPMNSNYDPIVIDVTSSSFRCLGKLKKSIREY